MTQDADEPQRKKVVTIGEDLYDFSVAELNERILALHQEILRVEGVAKEKSSGLNAANALFGKS